MKCNLPNTIEAVSFDAAGTLFRAFPSVGYHYALEARRFGVQVDPEIIESRFRNVFNARGGLASLADGSSERAEKEWWRETVVSVFSGFGLPKPFDEFFDALYVRFSTKETWKLYDDVLATLDALKKKRKVLAVLSNWDSRLLSVLGDLEIRDYFYTVIISAQAGAVKPHNQIFRKLSEKLQLQPEQILHVGDNYVCDFEGALAAGFQALHIDRDCDRVAESDVKTIRTLDSLIRLL